MQFSFITLLLAASSAIAAPTAPLVSRSDSCMAKGAKVSSWTVHDFDLDYSTTKAGAKTNRGTVSFSLENKALSYRAKCKATSTGKNFFVGGVTYKCQSGSSRDSASFRFDHKSGTLAINQAWACASEGGRYEASGKTKLNLSCQGTNGRVSCDKKTVKAPITQKSAVL
ncbi:hypothetical protein BGZ61DRAFT_455607 [Ilyonectria robusta]|uniref:uncharacterized protein n=1 Tax=Ilyonectria robusta TaxID=1079257 RepID=UPI001E8DB212|nr:uncharacterized protein BGZ61DRAFT_455607 [Ilyonectria robusta]KAH8684073.1 hypothetical protein BGZ61DRAFT_455607 [Ilyonectria robusta]